jgi:hypothetical protein
MNLIVTNRIISLNGRHVISSSFTNMWSSHEQVISCRVERGTFDLDRCFGADQSSRQE